MENDVSAEKETSVAVAGMVAIGVKGERCTWLSELPPVMTWAEFARECSKMERKGFTIKQVPRAEGFAFLTETFYRDHPHIRPTAQSQERSEPSPTPAEPLQGAHAPPIPTLQEDTAHHATAQSGFRGIGVGTLGSLPPVATPPTTTNTTGE
jgi:hypothetical protein